MDHHLGPAISIDVTIATAATTNSHLPLPLARGHPRRPRRSPSSSAPTFAVHPNHSPRPPPPPGSLSPSSVRVRDLKLGNVVPGVQVQCTNTVLKISGAFCKTTSPCPCHLTRRQVVGLWFVVHLFSTPFQVCAPRFDSSQVLGLRCTRWTSSWAPSVITSRHYH